MVKLILKGMLISITLLLSLNLYLSLQVMKVTMVMLLDPMGHTLDSFLWGGV
jgi:hypothetical protein